MQYVFNRICLIVLAAALLPGCTLVTFGPTKKPDPLADQAVMVESFDGERVHLGDGRRMELAGIDGVSLTESQRLIAVKYSEVHLPAEGLIDELDNERCRVELLTNRYPMDFRRVGCGVAIIKFGPPIKFYGNVYPLRHELAIDLIAAGVVPARLEELESAQCLPVGKGDLAFQWPGPSVASLGQFNRHPDLIKLYEYADKNARSRHLGIYRTDADRFVDAAGSGDLETMRRLYKGGVSVDAVSLHNSTAMHGAINAGSEPIISWLLDRGYDINTNPGGGSPLQDANGKPKSEKILLERGAKLDDRMTATRLLINAAREDNAQLIALALQQKIDVDGADHQGNTPLMFAAVTGSLQAMRVLLDHGADPKHQNQLGQTAVDWAMHPYGIRRKKSDAPPWMPEALRLLAESTP